MEKLYNQYSNAKNFGELWFTFVRIDISYDYEIFRNIINDISIKLEGMYINIWAIMNKTAKLKHE